MSKRNWIRAIALILSLVLLGTAGCTGVGEAWQEQFELGMQYLEEEDYEEAIYAFSDAIEIDPENPEAYLWRGKAYLGLGDPDKALKDFKRARRAAKEDDRYEDLVEELDERIDELEEDTDREGSDGDGRDWPIGDDWHPEAGENPRVSVADAYTGYLVDPYGTECCFHIPQIHLDGDKAAAVNETIYRELYRLIEDTQNSLVTYGYLSSGNIRYQWGIRGDILSVVVEVCWANYHWLEYYVYSISLETGEQISGDRVLEAFGMDREAYYAAAELAVAESYSSLYSGDIVDEMNREFYDSLVASSCARENLENSVPFVGEDGALRMVVNWFSPAGAASYWEVLGVNSHERHSWFSCMVDHAAQEVVGQDYSPEEITDLVADWYNANLGGYEEGYLTASDQETYVDGNLCVVVVRLVNTAADYTGEANVLVATVAVDMTSGEMWLSSEYLGDLW